MTVVVDDNGQSSLWKSYVDLNNDVKPWMQYPVQDDSQDANIQLLIDMTCQWAQQKLGQPIGPMTFDRRFNGWSGWNGAYLTLPYFPVLQVVSVAEYWGIAGPHNLSESTPTNQVDGFQMDYQRGIMTRVFPGNVQKPWFPGSRNVEIVWTAGFNPIPADLKVATLEMIKHWWVNTQQQSSNRLGAGGAAQEYDPEEVANGLWTGVPFRIIDLLESRMQVGMA